MMIHDSIYLWKKGGCTVKHVRLAVLALLLALSLSACESDTAVLEFPEQGLRLSVPLGWEERCTFPIKGSLIQLPDGRYCEVSGLSVLYGSQEQQSSPQLLALAVYPIFYGYEDYIAQNFSQELYPTRLVGTVDGYFCILSHYSEPTLEGNPTYFSEGYLELYRQIEQVADSISFSAPSDPPRLYEVAQYTAANGLTVALPLLESAAISARDEGDALVVLYSSAATEQPVELFRATFNGTYHHSTSAPQYHQFTENQQEQMEQVERWARAIQRSVYHESDMEPEIETTIHQSGMAEVAVPGMGLTLNMMPGWDGLCSFRAGERELMLLPDGRYGEVRTLYVFLGEPEEEFAAHYINNAMFMVSIYPFHEELVMWVPDDAGFVRRMATDRHLWVVSRTSLAGGAAADDAGTLSPEHLSLYQEIGDIAAGIQIVDPTVPLNIYEVDRVALDNGLSVSLPQLGGAAFAAHQEGEALVVTYSSGNTRAPIELFRVTDSGQKEAASSSPGDDKFTLDPHSDLALIDRWLPIILASAGRRSLSD